MACVQLGLPARRTVVAGVEVEEVLAEAVAGVRRRDLQLPGGAGGGGERLAQRDAVVEQPLGNRRGTAGEPQSDTGARDWCNSSNCLLCSQTSGTGVTTSRHLAAVLGLLLLA